MRQFLDCDEWREHVYRCLEDNKLPNCPHPRSQCADAFDSAQELKFHLRDVHCVQFIKGSKKSRPADEVGDTLPKRKRARGTNKNDVNMEFEAFKFIDETAKFWSHEMNETLITSSTFPSTAPSTAPSTPPSIDSTQMTD